MHQVPYFIARITLVLIMLAAVGVVSAADQNEKPKDQNPTTAPADTSKEKPTMPPAPPVPPALNFTMKNIDGKDVPLSQYQGKVVLMVNVASHCGYTKQYKDLEALHEKYASQGLAILGFPANEFGKQEPGSDAEIKTFCTSTYNVKFDMFSKIVVKGEGQHPLYKFLTDEKTDPKFPGPIGWNFEKFLIGRDGQVVGRYKSAVNPMSDELVKAVETELARK